MKKKGMTYGLLIFMVVIWAVVIAKIVGMISGDKNQVQPITLVSPHIDTVFTIDSFEILANYRDPFLGKTFISAPTPKKQIKKKSPKKIIKTIKKPSINWSFIQYHGSMTNQMSDKSVAVLSLNGSEHMLATGDSASGVTLLTIYSDSVKVMYKKEQKFINRSLAYSDK